MSEELQHCEQLTDVSVSCSDVQTSFTGAVGVSHHPASAGSEKNDDAATSKRHSGKSFVHKQSVESCDIVYVINRPPGLN